MTTEIVVQQKAELQAKPKTYWQKSEQENLIKLLTIYIEGAAYNTNVSVKNVFLLFQHKLEGRYTVEQVMKALDIYTDQSDSVPHPSHVIQIIRKQQSEKRSAAIGM